MPTDQQEETPEIEDAIRPDLSPTSPTAWKKSPVIPPRQPKDEGFIVALPSDNVVRMTRTMDMPLLLKTGKIPNPLAGIVQKMIDARTPSFPEEAVDTEVMMQLLDLMHETVVRCVIEPPFDMPAARKRKGKSYVESADDYQERLSEWTPDFTEAGAKAHAKALKADPEHGEGDGDGGCECERKISVWDMDMEDRFFIFAVAQGAAADLASFREEQERTLASVQAKQGVRVPTKRTGGTGSKKRK